MKLAIVNYAYSDALPDPESLLAEYRTLTGWSDALANAGHSVAVVQRFHCDGQIVRGSVEYLFCRDSGAKEPGSSLWPRRMHRAIVQLRADIVHVNGLDRTLQTWLLRRSLPASTAMVVQDHGGGPPAGIGHPNGRRAASVRFPRSTVRRVMMRAPDAFFFTATAQATEWRRAGMIRPNQSVHQVPEASATMRPHDRSIAKRETGVQGDPAVLWVGRLNQNKSPLTVLEGFERSLGRLPDAVLTMIYGSDDLLPSVLERLRASPLLANHVRLLGPIPHQQMSAFYSAADLFVLGSHHEGSGYALIEACACGLPPVVTDIPAFRAITADGTLGALWPQDDAAALAEALVRVSSRDRPALRRQVQDHFDRALSWSAIARLASAAYSDIVGGRRSR